jgi:hypothetical protein
LQALTEPPLASQPAASPKGKQNLVSGLLPVNGQWPVFQIFFRNPKNDCKPLSSAARQQIFNPLTVLDCTDRRQQGNRVRKKILEKSSSQHTSAKNGHAEPCRLPNPR